MKIGNHNQLARTDLREAALQILEAGLSAIDTKAAVRRVLQLEDGYLRIGEERLKLSDFRKIVVVGAGKCSLAAAQEAEEILGDLLSTGVIIDVRPGKLTKVAALSGDHPLPTERNVAAARKLIESLAGLSEKDLVLMLISGGGSTLLAQPPNSNFSIEKETLAELFRQGATIQEINIIRKHLSLARGGHLAKYAYPARVYGLIFSDVAGNDLSSIASGPSVLDSSSIADAKTVLRKFNIDPAALEIIETPKEQKYFERVKNLMVVSNEIALRNMSRKCEELGFEPWIVTATLQGEASSVGKKIAQEISAAPAKSAYLYGGETTVTVKGSGQGGRNRELVLGGLEYLAPDTLLSSLASDGRDNAPVAGALGDRLTQENARLQGLASKTFLSENNSSEFFEKVQDFLETGDTGANVSDLVVALKN